MYYIWGSEHAETVMGHLSYIYEFSFPIKSANRHTAKNQYRKFEQIFPGKELQGHGPNFHIHVSVSDLYSPAIDLPIRLQENMWTDPGNI